MSNRGGETMTEAPPQEALVPCSYCQRTFGSSIIERHMVVCTKAMARNSRRIPFDSLRQRMEGTEMKGYQGRAKRNVPAPPNHWRQRHTELVAAVRNARLTKRAIERGEALPPPPPPAANPDYIQCVYCGRRFNQTAAERHIPFCKEKSERNAMNVRPQSTAKRPPNSRQ